MKYEILINMKLAICLHLSLALCAIDAFAAAPGNDNKNNATTLTQKTNWTSSAAFYTNVGATNDGATGTCGAPNNNVWFKFQATTPYIDFRVLVGGAEGSLSGPAITIWNSSNAQVACVPGASSSSTLDVGVETEGLVVGEWYYVSVQAYSSSNTYEGTFTLYLNDAASNNFKVGALELTQKDHWCSALAAYTNVGATADATTSACGSPSNNVWFKFQTATQYIKFDVKTGSTEGTIQYPELVLWNNSGVAVTCVDYTGSSGDVSLERLDLTVGEWYYVSVQTGLSSSSNQGTFTVCVNDQPSNDHKVGALSLTQKNQWCSTLAAYTNVGATADATTSSCGSPNNNVWFKFQAATQYIKFDVKTGSAEGTIQYPEMVLWNNSGVAITCVDDTGSSGDVSIERLDLTVGEWYYVSVQTRYSSTSNHGTFTVCVNDQPSNDHKIGAVSLTEKDHWCSPLAGYTNVGATADATTSSCGSPDNNVWFKFQAATQYIKFDVKTGSTEGTIQYPELVLWNNSGSVVACVDYTGASGDVSLERVDLTVGEWYYISVQTGPSSTSNQGTFTVCVNDQPSNDHKIGALSLTQKNHWTSPLAGYTNVGATADGGSSSCGSPNNNVWFKFQAETPYVKVDVKTGSTEGTLQYPEIVLWNNSGIVVTCAENTGQYGDVALEQLDLSVGSWYYLSVQTNLISSSYQGTFTLGLNDQAPYDHKMGAIIISNKNWLSASALYDNIGATADGGSSTCGSPNSNVWFKFQASTSYIRIDVRTGGAEGTIQNPEIALWNSSGTAVACQNNTGTLGDVSLIKPDVTINEWYYISVYTANTSSSNQGTFTFGIFDIADCANIPVTYTLQTTTTCLGQSSGSVTLTNSQTGVVYTLNGVQKNGVDGQSLTWANLSAGDYPISAVRGSCTPVTLATATISSEPAAQSYALTPLTTTTLCAGTSFQMRLEGSQTQKTYQLIRTVDGSSSNVGTPVAGTNSPITFPAQTIEGTYSVNATSTAGCVSAMQNPLTFTVNPLPANQATIGSTVLCDGQSGLVLKMEDSQSGVAYLLAKSGYSQTVNGTGNSIEFTNVPTGTYSITATNTTTNCQRIFAQTINVTSGATPAAFNLVADVTMCYGQSALIGIQGTASNVKYQVFAGTQNFGLPVVGTTSSSFKPLVRVADAGSYQVLATHMTSGCTKIMTGTTVVSVNPLPEVFNISGGGVITSGVTQFPVSLDGSQNTGVSYQLKKGTMNIGSPLPGNGSALSWPFQSAKGTYTIVATNSTTGCVNFMDGSATIYEGYETILNNLAFQYRYDARKRMVGKKVPGADWVWMVYDERDRLVLTQDGVQRTKNEWLFTKYDSLNRPVVTGVYAHGAAATQAEMAALIDQRHLCEAYNGVSSTHGYSNTVWPTSNLTVLTATYYDDYAFVTPLVNNGDANVTTYNYKPDELPGQYQYDPAGTVKHNPRVVGMVTGTKTSIPGTGEYLYSVNYYDDKYRVVQNIEQNHLDGIVRLTTNYDFTGKITQTKKYYLANGLSTSLRDSLHYDHAGRLLEVHHSVNDGPEIVMAENVYNELGQLADKKLHSENNGASFKQSLDYRYNIRGWLTKINESSLQGGDAGDPADLFGMQLAYNDDLGTGNAAANNDRRQYNGNISAMSWSANLGLADVKEHAYNYSYDALNRIKAAEFRQKSGAWMLPPGQPYSERNYNYDLNGNILSLTRMDAGGVMDSLIYTYFSGPSATRGNQLLQVADHGNKSRGFIDGVNGGYDYSYDPNGNMTRDENKDIEVIRYNHLNLPSVVLKENGDSIRYIYDAGGRKLSQQVFEQSAQPVTRSTDYLGELVFENGALKLINTAEGRIIPGPAPEYQYHLKDHLGNVRMTFTTVQAGDTTQATMETASALEEQSEFINYEEAIKVNHPIFDHTHDGSTGSTYYSTRLTGGNTNAIYGLARSLSVMPGDQISMEVYAKYLDPDENNWTAAMTDFIAAVRNGTAPAGTLVDGGLVGSLGSEAFPYPNILDHSGESGTPPKAYLNWIVFDRDFNPIIGESGYARISEAARERGDNVPHEKLTRPSLLIKQPGYVYIYLSNENETPVEVFFDDFRVEHVKSPVVQVDEYYPFGLAFNSYNRENSTPNKYKFNGKEEQTELGLGWLDYGARMYMSDIGRWGVNDPNAVKYADLSPYNYVYNNPVNAIDPDGRDGILIVFPDKKIEGYGRKWSGLGHAGVLLIDNKTGYTKYYEYGRYDDGNVGLVRTYAVSNVTMDKNGKPTVKSLNKVMKQISKKSGGGTRIEGAYIKSDDFDAMNDYAKSRLAENDNPNREPYDLTSNNCGTFACDVLGQDPQVDKDAPTIIDPRPNSVVEEYQDEFDKVSYDSKTGVTTYSVNKKYFEKYLNQAKEVQKKKEEEEKNKQ